MIVQAPHMVRFIHGRSNPLMLCQPCYAIISRPITASDDDDDDDHDHDDDDDQEAQPASHPHRC